MKRFFVDFSPQQGRRHHYYHFFYGVFLPVSRFLMNQKALHEFTLCVEDCGPMNRHLRDHPFVDETHRIEIVKASRMPKSALPIRGSDFPLWRVSAFLKSNETLRRHLLDAFGCTGSPTGGLLVVDRGRPDDAVSRRTKRRLANWKEFDTTKYDDRSGAGRRYLENINRLTDLLRSNKIEHSVVRLEELDMRSQATLFWNAHAIIGQHGAGFANLYFCQNTKKFIEFGARGRQYFATISHALGIERVNVPTFPASNGPCYVNAQRVVEQLKA